MNKFTLSATILASVLPINSWAINPCGTIMCLSHGAGRSLSSCTPYLVPYFDIKFDEPWKTISERLKFLNGCSFVSSSLFIDGFSIGDVDKAKLASLKSVIVSGAGWCDADYLAAQLNEGLDSSANWEAGISSKGIDEIPPQCLAYADHSLTVGIRLPEKVSLGCKDEWVEGKFGWANVSVCTYKWAAPPMLTEDEIIEQARADAEEYLRESGLVE